MPVSHLRLDKWDPQVFSMEEKLLVFGSKISRTALAGGQGVMFGESAVSSGSGAKF